jgi:hypothetical protein
VLRRAEDAIEYLGSCRAAGDTVHLVLLDLFLNGDVPQPGEFGGVQDADGFAVGDTLDAADGPDLPVSPFFVFKPLIAMVTSAADQVRAVMPIGWDGSVGSCDVLLQKPLHTSQMRALLQGCYL